MEIWDLHCHLSGVPGNTPEVRLGKLLEYADRMGIARLCVFMGMEWSYDPSPEKMRQENDEVLGALRNFPDRDRKSTRLNSSHLVISYAVFCLKKKKNKSDNPAHSTCSV